METTDKQLRVLNKEKLGRGDKIYGSRILFVSLFFKPTTRLCLSSKFKQTK
jgi:hypothetical protein